MDRNRLLNISGSPENVNHTEALKKISENLTDKSIPSDGNLLDAYSSAVINVVEKVGPSVVSISIGWRLKKSGMENGGAGSGVINTAGDYI